MSSFTLSSIVRHQVPVFSDMALTGRLAGNSSLLNNAVQTGHVSANGNRGLSSFGIFLEAGSRFETRETSGSSALLQKVIQNDSRVTKAFQECGATLKSVTDRDINGFYATCVSQDAPKLHAALAEAIRNPVITKETVDAQRNTLLREVVDFQSDAFNMGMDHTHETAYMLQGLALPALGTEEGLQGNTTCENVQNFYTNNYLGHRIASVIASDDISNPEWIEAAAQGLESIPQGTKVEPYTPWTSSVQSETNTHLPEAYLLFSYRLNGLSYEKLQVLDIIKNIYGQWSIEQQLATQHAFGRFCSVQELASRYFCQVRNYEDTGMFTIFCEGAPGVHCNRLIYYIPDEMNRMVRGIDDEELERSKAITAAEYIGRFDTPEKTVLESGRSLLNQQGLVNPDSLIGGLSSINTDAVIETLQHFFNDVDPAVVYMGPVDEAEAGFKIRKYTTWWRD